jgi:hypothetical protein
VHDSIHHGKCAVDSSVSQLVVQVADDVLLRGFADSHCEVGGFWFAG